MQLRRHKDRLTKSKRRTGHENNEHVQTEDAVMIEEEDLDGIVGEEAGLFEERLTVAEAAAELRISPREAFGFVNADTQRRMLVFKRRDGQVGVVDVHLD
jgi:hypothetical protein